jgi:hypothetical protein
MTSGEYLGWFFMTPFSQQWSLYKPGAIQVEEKMQLTTGV